MSSPELDALLLVQSHDTRLDQLRHQLAALPERAARDAAVAAVAEAERVIVGTTEIRDDLARQANDSHYGLAAGIWTRDISKAHRLAKRIKSGTVHVNTYHVFAAELPFGGYKQSGWGREMGEEVLKNYLETKSVIVGL